MRDWGKWASGLNLILGLALIAVPFLFGHAGVALWNEVVVGALVAGLALARMVGQGAWASWTNLAVAIWLIISPYVLGYGQQNEPTMIAAWMGTVIALLALASAALSDTSRQRVTFAAAEPTDEERQRRR